MKVTIEPPPAEGEPLAPLHRRVGWFIGLALASALATAVVAYALKALLV